MKKNSIIGNYIYNLVYQILLIFLPLITTPYISRTLGAEGIGRYSFVQAISSYFVLFSSMGFTLYGQREIAFVQKNIIKRSNTLYEIAILKIVTSCICIFAYSLFIHAQDDKILFIIQTMDILAVAFDVTWFFQGLEEFKKIVIRNLVVKILSIILIFTFVKVKNDLVIYVFLISSSTLFSSISLLYYLPKYICKVNFKSLNFFKHVIPSLYIFIPQIAIKIYSLIDRIMLGNMVTNISELGYYDQAQKIIHLSLTIVTCLGTVMLPRIAAQFSQNKTGEIIKYIGQSFQYTFFLSCPITLGLCGISKDLVPWFYGPGYERVIVLLVSISFMIFFSSITGIIGTQYLIPTKHQKEYNISVISGALINVILNYLLIPNYYAIGASIATVISELVIALIQTFYIRDIFKIKNIMYLSKTYLIASIIMLLSQILISNFIYSALLSTIMQLIIGILVYFIVLYIFKDSMLMYVFKIIKNKGKDI